jgi:hypothetical protein
MRRAAKPKPTGRRARSGTSRASPEISLEQARAAKAEAVRRCAAIGAVTGVGLTRVGGSYAVKVNLSRSAEGVPTEIDGVPVTVEVAGPVRARR